MAKSSSTSAHAPSAGQKFDVVLIGAGIMSTTLGSMLKELEPDWTIGMFESLDQAGQESSDPWNNAGTGHAALCELNYTPRGADGKVSTAKAQGINEQFTVSKQLYSHWVKAGTLGSPRTFINGLPHISFVWGDKNAEYLQERYEAMKAQPLFSDIVHTEDHAEIAEWAPLLIEGRDPSQRVAASKFDTGTDVDYGSLTRQLATHLDSSGVEVRYGHEVQSVKRGSDGRWDVKVKDKATVSAAPPVLASSSWAPAAVPWDCCRAPGSTRSRASAGSPSPGSSCAARIRRWPSVTTPRSTALPRWALRRCRSPTSTPGSWKDAAR